MADISVPVANALFEEIMQYAVQGSIAAFPKLVFYTAPYISPESGPQGSELFTITLRDPISSTGPVAGTLPLDVSGIVATTIGTGKAHNAWLLDKDNDPIMVFTVGTTDQFDIQLEDDNIYQGSEARPQQIILRFGCPS